MKPLRIAVLGAGIMGCSVALLLARRGHHVALFDAAQEPFSGASRWNEGKIHLGFLYSADPSLDTARKVIPGGLLFRPLVEQLIGQSIGGVVTQSDDLYLCHRDSVVSPDSMRGYMAEAMRLVNQHPDAANYLADVRGARATRLSNFQLRELTDSADIVAGFRVPERSVSTNWIADKFVAAVSSQPRVECHMNSKITAVRSASGSAQLGPWLVVSDRATDGPFDWAINALWEGRIAVDLTAGVIPERSWSNRYRLALFVRTKRPLDLESAIVATGPFGDVKNYGGGEFYASWYPLGLMVDSPAISPPTVPTLDEEESRSRAESILDRLAAHLPRVGAMRREIESIRMRGGWVHASGGGSLSDPRSDLHQRSKYGVMRTGTYLSVDTGKYSTAPWLAHQIVEMVR